MPNLPRLLAKTADIAGSAEIANLAEIEDIAEFTGQLCQPGLSFLPTALKLARLTRLPRLPKKTNIAEITGRGCLSRLGAEIVQVAEGYCRTCKKCQECRPRLPKTPTLPSHPASDAC